MDKSKKAFTLIEVIVVILIIMIFYLTLSNYNFSGAGDIQRLETFTNRVMAEIETAKTNALVGRGVGTQSIIPSSWTITFNHNKNIASPTQNDSSIIVEYYYTDSNGNEIKEEFSRIDFPNQFRINNTICNPNNVDISPSVIRMEGNRHSLSGDCLDSYNLLTINIGYRGAYYDIITFDALNGLIERKKD